MTALPPCPESIPSQTLSALTDDGLEAAEAARLRAHAATCPACQATLAAYDAVDRLVRDQPIPAAAPVDVASVRAGQPAPMVARGRPGQTRARIPRAVWGGIGAVAAAALLIAAFGQVFSRLGRLTPTATVTPVNASHFGWQQRTIPAGLTLFNARLDAAFSPANPQDGWICVEGAGGDFTIWATGDQARSWRVAGQFTDSRATTGLLGCDVVPDSLNPKTLALSFAWGCAGCGQGRRTTYLSADGGATWRALDGDAQFLSLATVGSRVYALGYATAINPAAISAALDLYASDDGMATWRIAGPTPPFGGFQFLWPDPATGALLLAGFGANLWRSDPTGASWTPVTLPASFHMALGAWEPAGGGWRLCGDVIPADGSSLSYSCTSDLGATWTSQPGLVPTVTCANCGAGGQPSVTHTACAASAMTPDGALLAYCERTETVTADLNGFTNATMVLYRLAPRATTWASLGSPPPSVAHPFPTPLSGTPANNPALVAGQIIFPGNHSTTGAAVWYSDPLAGILAVSRLP